MKNIINVYKEWAKTQDIGGVELFEETFNQRKRTRLYNFCQFLREKYCLVLSERRKVTYSVFYLEGDFFSLGLNNVGNGFIKLRATVFILSERQKEARFKSDLLNFKEEQALFDDIRDFFNYYGSMTVQEYTVNDVLNS